MFLDLVHIFFKKMTNPGLFSYILIFTNTFQILQQISMWKNVDPVIGAGIQTHNLWNMSFLL